MTRGSLRILPALVFVAIGASFQAVPAAGSEATCTSSACHASLVKVSHLHPPAESCDSCHESMTTPHPQQGKKTFKLSQEPPELCYACHDAFGKKSTAHPPVKEGLCTTCHNPHGSDQPKLLAQAPKELCGTCHPEPTNHRHLHGPVAAGDCLECHTPHESDSKSLLRKEGEALCFGCHQDLQEVLRKSDVHPAVSAGCTSCHNPHGAANPGLLAESGAALCYQCHGDIEEKLTKSPVVHAAVTSDKGCVGCHSPHATDAPGLLLKPQEEICLGCHRTIITRDMTTLHGPIKNGSCTACHEPHGGGNARLLVKEFPADPYSPYTDTEYGLCFSCHKRDLVQYPDTSFATNFRDGERNLHYLHVNKKEKGRSCILCHSVHGSSSPVLIADSVPFGKWSLPLKFVKTETGGGCSPGCHKPAHYDRQSPGRKPEPPRSGPAKGH